MYDVIIHKWCCWHHLSQPGPYFFSYHDDVIKWKHFPRYWPFVRGIHRSPVNSPHKGQWRGALTFSLICAWTNGRVDNRDAGDLRHHRAHYDDTVIFMLSRHDGLANASAFIHISWLWLRNVVCRVDYGPNVNPGDSYERCATIEPTLLLITLWKR